MQVAMWLEILSLRNRYIRAWLTHKMTDDYFLILELGDFDESELAHFQRNILSENRTSDRDFLG